MTITKSVLLQDPDDFCYQSSQEQGQLRQRLVEATKKLKGVHMPPDVQLKISEVCSLLDVDGIRGDIVTNRAAKALVAFEGREEVSMTDVEKVIGLCLNHRYSLSPLSALLPAYTLTNSIPCFSTLPCVSSCCRTSSSCSLDVI